MNPSDALVKFNTYLLAVVTLAVVGLGGMSLYSPKKPNPRATEQGVVAGAFADALPSATPSPTPTATPTPVADPVRLNIPKLNIDAPIEPVGVDDANTMEAPAAFTSIGWYTGSAKPGEQSDRPAIINGHFDTTTGSSAIFFHLEQLVPGDELSITTADGTTFMYSVESSDSLPFETFPPEAIYGSVHTPTLKIITCDGLWSPSKRSYSNRLVVTARLANTAPPVAEDTP